MTVAIAEVGRRGRLDIAFALHNGRTALRHCYCEVPFKITRPFDADIPGFAHLILMQCTAGLFGGDDIECSIHVESGARVLLTQQSATKIHPAGDRIAVQRTKIHVASGAQLIADYEPVIPFAGSRLRQSTQIEVEPGASLVFWEGMMAGRVGRDERWQFRDFQSETLLNLSGKPLYLERFSLDPTLDNPESSWIMKNCAYVGTGLCFREGAAEFSAALHDAMPEAGVDVLASNLLAVRVATASGPNFHRFCETFRRNAV